MVRVEPRLVPKPWGGRRLAAYGKAVGAAPVGEAWEVWPGAPGPAGALGVTVKFLDATENLSVQVHPSTPGETKHECWIVLEPPAGGVIYAGLHENGDPAGAVRSAAAARADEIDEHLLALEVAPGDAVVLPSGIVHALTAGGLVYEVSEPRDATYRIHDWGRTGRATHIAEAADAARPVTAQRIPRPAAGGSHPIPLPAAFPFAVIRHVGPCAVEAVPGRAYTRLAGPGRGETFVVDEPARLDLPLGAEVMEARLGR